MKKILSQIKQLSKEKRHMMALFWIQAFANAISSLFINVFVFLETQSITFLIVYSMIYHIAIFIGFVGVGYLFGRIQKSVKINYLYGFLISFLSFVWVPLVAPSMTNLLVFAVVNGVGGGIFWMANHAYELAYTKNEDRDRDFYSSIEHAGSQIISMVAVIIGTILIFLAERIFHVETFTILFWFLPFVFLGSLPFLFSLPDHIPQRVSLTTMFRFLKWSNGRRVAWYYIFSNEQVASVAVTLFSVVALTSALNIGMWQSIVGIIAFATTLWLANIRRAGNRVQIMKYALVGYVVVYGMLMFSDISLYFYIIFTLGMIVLKPMYRISQHVIDLRSVNIISTQENGSFSGLLARDTILGFSRTFHLTIALLIASTINDNVLTAKVLILFYLLVTVGNWFIVRKVTQQ